MEADTITTAKTRLASFVLVSLTFALLYKEAPTVETRWWDVWPGAVFATVMIGKVVFVAYLDYVADPESVFGSLSSIMVLLLWLYVSAIALIVGAEYNTVRAERRA
ncbi:MAG: YihY/virulence factor BrkB family protein [Planctomycetota bacterium]